MDSEEVTIGTVVIILGLALLFASSRSCNVIGQRKFEFCKDLVQQLPTIQTMAEPGRTKLIDNLGSCFTGGAF